MTRLRNQNALLARMLQEEKAKTTRLRTDLISNLTSMIVDFTAVADVQTANTAGIEEMGVFQHGAEVRYDELLSRNNEIEEELGVAVNTASKQRSAGQSVSDTLSLVTR